MGIISFSRWRARRLHEKAQRLSASGMDDEALRLYHETLKLDPQRPTTLYNIGLIHKYRLNWADSLDFNARAYALAPHDQAARWNYAIAATALRDWATARRLWFEDGIEIEGETGPIDMDFGQTPVRLNPESQGEVVWARRLDPVRARVLSVPLPDSGFRFGDVVLHDGAAVGYRMLGESKKPVFNVLELFAKSTNSTYVAVVESRDQSTLEQALQVAADHNVEAEDWTTNFQVLCRQCSEGLPHEKHDAEVRAEWQSRHRIGLATADPSSVEVLLASWSSLAGFEVVESELVLQA